MTTSDLVGLRIKTVRRQRGLSQAQLAHPELSDSYVSLIESGKRTPTPAVLELLAQKLDCSLSYLLNGVTAEQMEDIELALGYARLALENGEVVEAYNRFTELLANNNLTGLTSLRQETEFGLALAAEACGDTDQAVDVLLRLRGEELPEERRIQIAIALCRVYRETERLSEAVEIGESMLGLGVRPVWNDSLVELAATLLAVYIFRGDLLRARQFAAELLNVADALGSPRSLVAANWNAALTAASTGYYSEAVSFLERAMALQIENGDPRRIARTRVALAQHHIEAHPDQPEVARDMLIKAIGEQQEASSTAMERGRALLELARVEFMMGDFDQVITHAHEARELLPQSGLQLWAEADLLLGRVYGATGRFTEAEAHVAGVHKWLTPMPDSPRSAATWYAAAETMEQLGDTDGAVDAYQRALACAGL
ncbi:tetratricopeptide repeat protein [Nonomuraea sp. NN258]|uniref:tetratricopeptide repeat protein n=1 Tax=Nonomuraea antri TaxID=2730852 RepID=UPI00156A2CC4|nr:tetratricopeptide repeat protein [Nonomuraea antri]NRQ38969.1 tetratricopeptide repeat protein [Nonomuraea antri]